MTTEQAAAVIEAAARANLLAGGEEIAEILKRRGLALSAVAQVTSDGRIIAVPKLVMR